MLLKVKIVKILELPGGAQSRKTRQFPRQRVKPNYHTPKGILLKPWELLGFGTKDFEFTPLPLY